mgnify:CR=1 FL=1
MSAAPASVPPAATAVAPGWGARLQLMAFDLVRYGLASAAALAVDYGLLLLLSKGFGVSYLTAAGAGFLAGMAVAYGLSIAVVFKGRRSVRPSLELASFVAIGVAGLALNQFLIWLFVSHFNLDVAIAKAPTAGFVFLFNFLARRALLFAPKIVA